MSNKIYPCLWFNNNAREAFDFYSTIFSDCTLLSENPMVVMFEINGQKIMALNGGPYFTPNEAFSLVVNCDTQDEIDHYWNKLTEGGTESRCGWLKDKFGFSWQIVPSILGELMNDPDRAGRVSEAFMKMNKMDIATLVNA